jgi:hypothetical protein
MTVIDQLPRKGLQRYHPSLHYFNRQVGGADLQGLGIPSLKMPNSLAIASKG